MVLKASMLFTIIPAFLVLQHLGHCKSVVMKQLKPGILRFRV